DYFFLKSICTLLLTERHLVLFNKYLSSLMEEYQDLAFDGYLLSGWLYQKNDDHKNALPFFEEAVKICPNSSMALAAAGISNLYLSNFTAAINLIKKAIANSRDNNIWQYVQVIALAHKQLNQETSYRETYSWPLELSKKDPFIVPQHIVEMYQEKLQIKK
ncbi:MAG: hypothetical protein GY730_10425, partial [bacterium]|nr:hypothetical protein [bacterium]